jgi:hypothetical protein
MPTEAEQRLLEEIAAAQELGELDDLGVRASAFYKTLDGLEQEDMAGCITDAVGERRGVLRNQLGENEYAERLIADPRPWWHQAKPRIRERAGSAQQAHINLKGKP